MGCVPLHKTQAFTILFVSDRSAFSRYMPYMVLQISRLPGPLLENFRKGRFVIKLTSGSINVVWLNYVLEATENKALKTTGSIIGMKMHLPIGFSSDL